MDFTSVSFPFYLSLSLFLNNSFFFFSPPSRENFKSYLQQIPLSRDDGSSNDVVANHVGHETENYLAKQLSEKVKLLCWIMTQPASHEKKAKHVKNTWGRRCNYLIFMSTEAGWLVVLVVSVVLSQFKKKNSFLQWFGSLRWKTFDFH